MARKEQITPEEFRREALPIMVRIGGKEVFVPQKEFSTGSLGWYASGKVTLEVGGKQVECQLGLTLTIDGSKPKKGK